MPPQEIQAVSFDAAGTLIHLAEPVGAAYARVAARFGIDAPAGELERSFGSLWKRTPPPFAVGTAATGGREKDWWRRFVRAVFLEAGAALDNDTLYHAFFEALYEHFESPGTWEADPEAAATLAALQRTRRCVVLSNFDSRLRRILADLGLLGHFDGLYLSCEIGASKPDRRIFEAAALGLSLAPGSILHVGDDPLCDWEGAAAAGFRVFRAGRRGRNLSDLLGELSLA